MADRFLTNPSLIAGTLMIYLELNAITGFNSRFGIRGYYDNYSKV